MSLATSRLAPRARLAVASLGLATLLAACGHQPPPVNDGHAWPGIATVHPDTLTIEEFLALPADVQARRRECAERHTESVYKLFDRRRVAVPISGVVDDLQQIVLWDPTLAAAWHLLGRIHGLHGQWAAALAEFEAAWSALDARLLEDGILKETALRRRIAADAGWTCHDRGWWPQAHLWLDRGQSVAPRDPELELITGLVYAAEGRLAEAVALAASLPSQPFREITIYGPLTTPTGAPSRWIHAVAQLHAGEPELAWRVLQPVRFKQPLMPWAHRYWQDVGRVYEMAGDPTADLAYQLAGRMRPFFRADPRQGFAVRPVVLGQPRPAAPYQVTVDGEYAGGSRFAYATQLVMPIVIDPHGPNLTARLERAETALDICLAHGIWPGRVRALRGRLAYATNRYESAELDLQAASDFFAARNEIDPRTELILGLLHLRADDHEGARPHLDRAVSADPALGPAWSALGAVQAAAGDTVAARAALNRAVALAPDLMSVWFNRGLFRARHGDLLGARDDLETSARIAGPEPEVVDLLQRVELARRQGRVALRIPDEGTRQIRLRTQANEAAVIAAGSVVDRASLTRQYLDDLKRTLEDRVGADRLHPATVDSLRLRYAVVPTPALRKELALAELSLGYFERTRAVLAAHWGIDLDAEEQVLLLYADRRVGDTSRAVDLIRQVAAGRRPVTDRYVWALVADAGRARVESDNNQTATLRPDAEVDKLAEMVSHWMDVGFAAWRDQQTSIERFGTAPPLLTRLDRELARLSGPETK